MATGQAGRKQYEEWAARVKSTDTTTINLPGVVGDPATGVTWQQPYPYPNLPQPMKERDGDAISYESVMEALELMGIDIPPNDIHSVLMEPDGITVEYYSTPKMNAKRNLKVYPMVFEKDQKYLWETAV